jgi:hypothetical protein
VTRRGRVLGLVKSVTDRAMAEEPIPCQELVVAASDFQEESGFHASTAATAQGSAAASLLVQIHVPSRCGRPLQRVALTMA